MRRLLTLRPAASSLGGSGEDLVGVAEWAGPLVVAGSGLLDGPSVVSGDVVVAAEWSHVGGVGWAAC